MKFQEGKFLGKIQNHGGMHEQHFFAKVWHENGHHFLRIDDGPNKLVDESVRDFLINDVILTKELQPAYNPQFKKVDIVVIAQGEFGTKHQWTRTSWESLEKLFRVFPGLVNTYVHDPHRREWLQGFLRNAHKMRNQRVFGKFDP